VVKIFLTLLLIHTIYTLKEI